MYDPEDTREVAVTWREYLRQAKGTFNVLNGAWRELKTPQAVRCMRRLVVVVVLAAAFSAVQPRAIAAIINGVIERNFFSIVVGIAGFFVLVIAQKIADRAHAKDREQLLGLNMRELDHYISARFFEKPIGQHIEEAHRLNPESMGKGRERLLGAQGIILFDLIPALVSLAFAFVLLLIFSPTSDIGMVGVFIVYGIWMVYLNRRVLETCTPLEIEWRRLNRHRFERLKGVKRVITSAKEGEEMAFMDATCDRILAPDLKFWNWYMDQSTIRQIVQYLGLVLVLIYGAYIGWHGKVAPGMLYPIFTWATSIVENLWRIGHAERNLNWHMPSIRHMLDALGTPPKFADAKDAITLPEHSPVTVVFENVSHAYPAETKERGFFDDEEDDGVGGDAARHTISHHAPVIKNISFSIAPGERVALIGPSGAGKTTIMALLLRFMNPQEGRIMVNGHDLRNVKLSSWMRLIGYIPQEAQIFDGTLRYNLTYALTAKECEEWSDDRLWEFMRKLRIDFGGRLTEGLETMVGERGVKLSGGQAQRVMIGAAAIKQPPFMIIDEATSHLDSSTEKIVHDGLANILAKNVGALIIAHRLSTVRDLCHRFIVLRNAEEVPDGVSQVEAIASSFEELYVRSPTFRMLADDQGVKIGEYSAI